jgi:hypothetical protein
MKAGDKSVATLALVLLIFPIISRADNTNWINSGASGKLLTASLQQQGCLGVDACSFSFGGPSFSRQFGSNMFLSGTCVQNTCTHSITGPGGGGVGLTTINGRSAGATVLAFVTKGKFTGGSVTAISGTGLMNVMVPEPSTLGLVGIGLFALAVILKRKLVGT